MTILFDSIIKSGMKCVSKAVFGSCKSISGKYSIFWKCYFPERKMFSCVWLYFKKFSEKYFLVFGKCYKEKTNPENTDKTRSEERRVGKECLE